jgi:hypothetical protein
MAGLWLHTSRGGAKGGRRGCVVVRTMMSHFEVRPGTVADEAGEGSPASSLTPPKTDLVRPVTLNKGRT